MAIKMFPPCLPHSTVRLAVVGINDSGLLRVIHGQFVLIILRVGCGSVLIIKKSVRLVVSRML